MHDLDLESDVHAAADQVAIWSKRVVHDPRHKARLREELLRRHQELTAESTQRAAAKLWPRVPGLKRLTLVAPPALAAVVALSIFVGALGVTGHRDMQAAEAARLTRAMVRTAPSLTSWKVSLHRNTGTIRFKSRLAGKRLLIQGSQTYLLSQGHWYIVTTDQIHAPRRFDWQWGFAVLPQRLANHRFTILPAETVGGRPADGIQYVVSQSAARTVVATAWVDPRTGLVMRLEREVFRGTRLIDRAWADYRYQRDR